MGEDVLYIFVVWFFVPFFMCFTSPMFSQAREAHRQADGLLSIAYCLNESQWGSARLGWGVLARCRAGSPRCLKVLPRTMPRASHSRTFPLATGPATMADPGV